MDAATEQFLRRLNELFRNLEQELTANHLQHMVQIFLFHEGVKPGVTMDVEWPGDLVKLQTQFIIPLQDLLGPTVKIVLEYWRRPRQNYHLMSLWILTDEITRAANLTSVGNIESAPTPGPLKVLRPRTIPYDTWWMLLGYPTDCAQSPAVLVYTVELTPEVKNVVGFCHDDGVSDVYRYGVDHSFLKDQRARVENEARSICAALAKLGKSTYALKE